MYTRLSKIKISDYHIVQLNYEFVKLIKFYYTFYYILNMNIY
jgi:hypothetical protein